MQMKRRSILKMIVLAVSVLLVLGCKKDKDKDKSYKISITQTDQRGAKATFTITKGDGDLSPTEYGLVYSKNSNPTVDDNKITISGDSESKTIKGLDLSTNYYVRAFVTDKNGTTYYDQLDFTTRCLDVDSIVPRSAAKGATVTIYGRGFGTILNNILVEKLDPVSPNENLDYPSSITNTTLTFVIPNTFVVGRDYFVGAGGINTAPCSYNYSSYYSNDFSKYDPKLKLTVTN
jgi:hypothetical protein